MIRVGITTFSTDQTVSPLVLARAIEERGFSSFFLPEHTHLPVEALDPLPGGLATLPEEYRRTLDPYVTMAAVATVTDRLVLGTGISLIAQHDPIALAKQIATIDHLAPGRFVLGVGLGWHRQEMIDHGVDFEARRAVTGEYLAAMQTLWRDEIACFDGDHVRFAPSYAWPKPTGGEVPTFIGGVAGPRLFDQIARLAHGWIPHGASGLRDSIPQLREAFERVGRDPASARVIAFGVSADADKLEYLASLGVEEAVVRIEPGDETSSLRALEEMAPLAELTPTP